ncbi:MAG: HAMP domain-containing histidine kinase [Lentisphaerae bacterium]|nr:HAMP domain-containing histidine kinase [Lentisphaerota bacterium]
MRFGRISAVDRLVQTAGVPLLACSMIVTTAIAGIPGWFFLKRALGAGHEGEALRVYAVIALCTALSEGIALAVGIFIFWRLSRRIKLLNDESRDLVRSVLHDIRTPLSRISSSAQLVLGGAADALDAASVSESCAQLLAIVDANAEITNNYVGAGEPPPHEVDFRQVVSEAAELFGSVAEMNGVALDVDLPSHPVVLMAHRHKLQQIAGNLLDNAVKFTPRGGRVAAALSETAKEVSLTVSDTGIGIAKGDQPKIFDRFFRSERGRSTPGSGLGLSLVHAVVTFYGGEVGFSSTPGRGTVFSVTLPKHR